MNTEKLILRRHGDVMIFTKKDFKIPKEVKLKSDKLIFKGLNNSHVIGKGDAKIAPIKDNRGYLRVTKDAMVTHVGGSSTHATKPLPKGDYWFEIQTFYDHLKEESKQVID